MGLGRMGPYGVMGRMEALAPKGHHSLALRAEIQADLANIPCLAFAFDRVHARFKPHPINTKATVAFATAAVYWLIEV